MRNLNKKGFTLVELLVVITILAIISVVAYQNFGWATDKAISGRKISDISTIETSLQMFKTENNYYPMPLSYNSWTNMWWYDSWSVAYPSNVIRVEYSWKAIKSLTWTVKWWWVVYGTWAYSGSQIWAKWVIWNSDVFGKKYLSKDLYDPEIWDVAIESTSKKMIDYGIGRYVYGVFAQPKTTNLWNMAWISGIYYNIATTVKKKDSESYESYIVWDFDEKSCEERNSCPNSLIWTSSWATNSAFNTVLINKDSQKTDTGSTSANQGIPYPIKDFSL